ncbi:MAG: 4Fe-4S binding protein [Oscillospiraceae bacterium]|nr:4Fe-4S binding protein [Oscillospiraceae bacterium]
MANYKIIFSPTGGTRKCADLLASNLGADWQEVDVSLPFCDLQLQPEDLCIVAVPSFGGRVPPLAADRLNSIAGNGAKAILVCVYGNRAFEDTLVELQDILTGNGFACVAAAALLAEHSIMHAFAAGRPDREDENVIAGFAASIAEKLDSCKSCLTIPGNRPYKEYKVAPMIPVTEETCTDCGLCAKLCPGGAIAGREIDPAKCICCMRCTAVCPIGAKHTDSEKVAGLVARLKDALSGRKENELFL